MRVDALRVQIGPLGQRIIALMADSLFDQEVSHLKSGFRASMEASFVVLSYPSSLVLVLNNGQCSITEPSFMSLRCTGYAVYFSVFALCLRLSDSGYSAVPLDIFEGRRSV